MTATSLSKDGTLDEGLLERLSNTEEGAPLVDAVGVSTGPVSHGQIVEQVAVVIEGIWRPEAALFIPPCREKYSQQNI